MFCGDTDEYDDCEFPDTEGLCVGHVVHCERCGRVWELVDMFDCKLWQSVMFFDADGNAVNQELPRSSDCGVNPPCRPGEPCEHYPADHPLHVHADCCK